MFRSLIIAAGLALPLTACVEPAADPVPNASEDADAQMLTVTGMVAYRERIALRPGSTLTVSLEDISIADRIAPQLATMTRTLDGEQVPLPFSLTVNHGELTDSGRYSVRAKIDDPSGALVWTTNQVAMIRPKEGSQELGTLQMISVRGQEPQPDGETVEFQCGDQSISVTNRPDSILLSVDGDRYTLTRTPSASGAQYKSAPETTPVMFWNKGDVAMLEIGDTSFAECKVIERG